MSERLKASYGLCYVIDNRSVAALFLGLSKSSRRMTSVIALTYSVRGMERWTNEFRICAFFFCRRHRCRRDVLLLAAAMTALPANNGPSIRPRSFVRSLLVRQRADGFLPSIFHPLYRFRG